MEKVTLTEKFASFSEHWRPKIVGELNGQEVKVVKFKGEFLWHHHEHEMKFFSSGAGGCGWSFAITLSSWSQGNS